jgi:reverse gyrase
MVDKQEIVYLDSCPVCGGEVSASRLLSGLPCEKHERWGFEVDPLFGRLGLTPRPQQGRWARLYLSGLSFAMVGPDGCGKSTSCMAFCLHSLSLGRRVLLLGRKEELGEARRLGIPAFPPAELPEGKADLIVVDGVGEFQKKEGVRSAVLGRLAEGGQLILSSSEALGRKKWFRKMGLEESPSVEDRRILMVVESPTKARTISGFFGPVTRRRILDLSVFETPSPFGHLSLLATGGHFYELAIEKGVYGAALRDGLQVYFKPLRPQVVQALRRLSLEADEVYVATDPDAEGEKIAWDVRAVVSPFNRNVQRILYHEVTKRAISEALSSPREFDRNLLHAQLLRRVEDAWIGLPLSAEIQQVFGLKTLSAGRVQTPVLGWVIEREDLNRRERVELINLTLANGFRLVFKAPKGTFRRIKEEGVVEVTEASEEVRELNPPPPHNTGSLLMQAGAFGIPPEELMRIAQDLFERGFITYHRTDATTVSALGMHLAKQYLSRKGLGELSKPRPWTSEGAHECIRPTRDLDAQEVEAEIEKGNLPPLTRRHLFIYGLVFSRFLASQMKPARVRYQRVRFRAGGQEVEVDLPAEVLERGFLEVLPLKLSEFKFEPGNYGISAAEKRTVGKEPLYTDGDLVRLMRERGIGRPSTYAPTVQKLRERRYVLRVGRGGLVPTRLGREVYQYLRERYPHLISEERTRILYQKMDEVESGRVGVEEVVEELWREVCDRCHRY